MTSNARNLSQETPNSGSNLLHGGRGIREVSEHWSQQNIGKIILLLVSKSCFHLEYSAFPSSFDAVSGLSSLLLLAAPGAAGRSAGSSFLRACEVQPLAARRQIIEYHLISARRGTGCQHPSAPWTAPRGRATSDEAALQVCMTCYTNTYW